MKNGIQETYKFLCEGIGHQIQNRTIEDCKKDAMSILEHWKNLDSAIKFFNSERKRLKHIGFNLWQTDIDSITCEEDLKEDLPSSWAFPNGYPGPSLDYWCKDLWSNAIDEKTAQGLKNLIIRFMEQKPYEIERRSEFWRDDDFLTTEDLRMYYLQLMELDQMIDNYLKTH